jgi:hypothetical protein
MTILGRTLLAALLFAAPGVATAASDHAAPPCGWSGGALPDPGQTQRCLASRYKPPKPKPPPEAPAPSQSSNATAATPPG